MRLNEEASTLGIRGVYRLWDDAADVGFGVRGKSVALLAFTHVESQRDRDNDVQAWKFAHGPSRSTLLDRVA
jgi:hypothetical protein